MRKTMKTTLAVLTSLALLPAAATAAYRVVTPFPGTVTATTYYSSGSFHGAVDIASGTCGTYGVTTPVAASLFWNVTAGNINTNCNGTNSGTQNEVKHFFADGYTFRLWHFIKTADSYSRTCMHCIIGNEGMPTSTGPYTHLQYDLNGTKDTSWYSGYTSKGEFLGSSETVGYF